MVLKRQYIAAVLCWLVVCQAAAQSINLVKNGTFESKEVTINSDFAYLPSSWTHGSYTFTDKVSGFGPHFIDPLPPTTGKYLISDVDESYPRRVWFDSINITPNTTYVFSCMAANVYKSATDPFNAPIPAPLIKLCVNGKKEKMLLLPEANSEWKVISGVFTSGPSQTRVEISIENMETAHLGNDVAIDNIFFGKLDTAKTESVQIIEKRDTLQKQEMVSVKEDLPVKGKDTLVAPVLVKADTVKTEVKSIDKVIIKKEAVKKTVPAVVAVKKKEPVPVKKTEVKKTPVAPVKKTAPSSEVKKKVNPPVVVKKTVPVTTKKPATASSTVKKETQTAPVNKGTNKTVASSSAFDKNIKKENMYVGQKLELKHIYFERSKFDLLETSLPELNNLVEFMNHYPSVRIRLEGHTDNVGDASKNIELSENRVKAVKKYLVNHKIAENRIECIGHGGAKALNTNQSEEEKKLNRRVEVVIIAK